MGIKLIDFETIKAKASDEIEAFVEASIQGLADQAAVASRIVDSLKKDGIEAGALTERQILFSAALSIVVADIGRQMSPYYVRQNREKIQVICAKRSLNVRFVERISVLWASFSEMFLPPA